MSNAVMGKDFYACARLFQDFFKQSATLQNATQAKSSSSAVGTVPWKDEIRCYPKQECGGLKTHQQDSIRALRDVNKSTKTENGGGGKGKKGVNNNNSQKDHNKLTKRVNKQYKDIQE